MHPRKTHRAAPIAALLAFVVIATAPLVAQTSPQVAVVFNLASKDLTVVDHKYRVFFNKFEKKTLPIPGYDLQTAIQDEVMNTLAEDKRFQWRVANEEDKLDGAKLAAAKNPSADMLASAKADRILLVNVVGFGAWISGLAKDRMEILSEITMLDRASGKKLWKTRIWEKIPFSGDLAKLQSEDQKELKQGVNALIEKACQKLKTKVAEKKA